MLSLSFISYDQSLMRYSHSESLAIDSSSSLINFQYSHVHCVGECVPVTSEQARQLPLGSSFAGSKLCAICQKCPGVYVWV